MPINLFIFILFHWCLICFFIVISCSSGNRNDWCFFCEFQSHIHRVSQSSHPFSPINILSRLPNIGGNLGYGKQEDAHEFMRFLAWGSFEFAFYNLSFCQIRACKDMLPIIHCLALHASLVLWSICVVSTWIWNMDPMFSKHLDPASPYANAMISCHHIYTSGGHTCKEGISKLVLISKHKKVFGLFRILDCRFKLVVMVVLYFVGLRLIQCNPFVSMNSGERKCWIWALKKQPLFNTYLVVTSNPRSNFLLIEDFRIFVYICCRLVVILYVCIIDQTKFQFNHESRQVFELGRFLFKVGSMKDHSKKE